MKRCNLIKRFFIGLLLIVVASISANAQEGLYVKAYSNASDTPRDARWLRCRMRYSKVTGSRYTRAWYIRTMPRK